MGFPGLRRKQSLPLREWKRAAEAVVTPNCKMQCQGCGAARFGGGICFEQRGGDAV